MLEIFTITDLNEVLSYVRRLNGIKQRLPEHPEGDALNHSLQVFYRACKETNDVDLILAALLHDVGKYESDHGHEQLAIEWLDGLCSAKTLWLIENHIRIVYYLNGDMKRHMKCKQIAEHPWLPELIQLRRFDNMGRNRYKQRWYNEEEIVLCLNHAVDRYFEDSQRKVGEILERDV